MTKPPLGLRPWIVAAEGRIWEILGAITRYLEADMEIPVEWAAELESLVIARNVARKTASGSVSGFRQSLAKRAQDCQALANPPARAENGEVE